MYYLNLKNLTAALWSNDNLNACTQQNQRSLFSVSAAFSHKAMLLNRILLPVTGEAKGYCSLIKNGKQAIKA